MNLTDLNWIELASEAQKKISPYLEETPLVYSEVFSKLSGKEVYLKLESKNKTGSFKVRPAFNGILTNLELAKKSGVLTTSSGNFAQAVAYAGHLLDVQTTIVMTDQTSSFKVKATERWGGEVVFCGNTFESRFQKLAELQKQKNALVLHGFDSIETISGNAVIGLELIKFFKDEPISVFVPSSGGGLVSGIASVLKLNNPKNEIFSVQPEEGGAIYHSFRAKKRTSVLHFETIADALVAACPGENTFKLISKFVDGCFLVSEEQVLNQFKKCNLEYGISVEPGGCIGTQALLDHLSSISNDKVVCVLTGSNFNSSLLS